MVIFHDALPDAGKAAASTRWVGGTWLAATALPREYWCLQNHARNIDFISFHFIPHPHICSEIKWNEINAKQKHLFRIYFISCCTNYFSFFNTTCKFVFRMHSSVPVGDNCTRTGVILFLLYSILASFFLSLYTRQLLVHSVPRCTRLMQVNTANWSEDVRTALSIGTLCNTSEWVSEWVNWCWRASDRRQ